MRGGRRWASGTGAARGTAPSTGAQQHHGREEELDGVQTRHQPSSAWRSSTKVTAAAPGWPRSWGRGASPRRGHPRDRARSRGLRQTGAAVTGQGVQHGRVVVRVEARPGGVAVDRRGARATTCQKITWNGTWLSSTANLVRSAPTRCPASSTQAIPASANATPRRSALGGPGSIA
ncbi:hypothetical protein QJS66_20130 [Kocuria rhizophila]|nr:hypothetical protein QJS66_20130 [Kocuria rhizophila]